MPHTLIFSFLLSSLNDVLGQRTETAVRVKMRRNENTMLPPGPPSTHSHLQSPGDATSDGASKNGGDQVRKHTKRMWDSCLTVQLSFHLDGWTQSPTVLQLPTQEAQVAFADMWPTGVWGESGRSSAFSGFFSSRECTPTPRKCSVTSFLSESVKNRH